MSMHRAPDAARGTALDRITFLVVLIATLPLFLDLDDRSITLARLVTGLGTEGQEAGTRVHLAIPLVTLLGVYAVIRRPRPTGALPWLVVGLVAWFTVAAAWGVARGGTLVGGVFYVQALVPLIAWVAAYQLPASPRTVARAVMVGTTLTAVVALVFTAFNGGLNDVYESSIALEGAVPQYRSYFPAIVAIAGALAVAHLRTDRVLSIATLVTIGLLIPITWSRGGLLMIGVAVAGTAAFVLLRRLTRRQLVLVALVGAVGIVAVAAFVLSAGLVAQRAELSDLQASDTTRITLARDAAERIAASPLVGDAFQPYSDDLAGGRTATFERLFPTHNQYLDHGIRAGLPAVLLLLGFLALTAARVWKAWRLPEPTPFVTAGLGILASLIPAALTELYLTQTWTGVVIMFVLGTAVAASEPLGRHAGTGEGTPVTDESRPRHGAEMRWRR